MFLDQVLASGAPPYQSPLPLCEPSSAEPPQPDHEVSCPGLVAAVRRLLQADKPASFERNPEVELLFARLERHMSEGVVLFDRAGEILYANDSLCRMLRYTRPELLGQRVQRFLGDVVERAMRAKPFNGSPYASARYETWFESRQGGKVIVLVSAHRVESGGGVSGCFALVSDISARVSTEGLLRQSQSDLRLLSAQLLAAEELERKRVARDLHDGLGQSLFGIKFGLESCGEMLARGDVAAAASGTRRLVDRMKGALEELRRISMNLRPAMLDDLGALATVSWFIREFRSLHRALRLETIVEVREAEIPPEARVAMYRIVQEALGNVVSHSRASDVWLTLQRIGDNIVLSVRDDGTGFDPAHYATVDGDGRGLGLASMRERAECSGGRFAVDSKPGHGTQILVHWHCQDSPLAGDWAAPQARAEGESHVA